jgi:hypothetical protein
MRFKVYLLRRRGRRLSWREARNGPVYVGRLVTHSEEHGGERYSVTRLEPDDPMKADEMPQLYEAVLLGFAPIAFRLRGFERVGEGDSAHGVVQEWSVEAA